MAGLEVDADYWTENSEDLSFSELDTLPDFMTERADRLQSLLLNHNQISILPRCIGSFKNLVSLDISNNRMTYISPEISQLQKLRTLTARNNNLTMDSLPKEFCFLSSLMVLNLSGNQFTEVPMQIMELRELTKLYFGGNRLSFLPNEISNLQKLQVLYLGGNRLEEVPDQLGLLSELMSLVLCDNRIESLPRTLTNLRKLQSLSLHNNRLSTLPPEIVTLELMELSLRNNPLVVRFVQDMVYEPPSLLELAGRVIKTQSVPYATGDLPKDLQHYLDSAQSCVNPKCKGVYFTSKVEHIKFVDFCGKYRLPLLQYLCSPRCTSSSASANYCSSSETESNDECPVVNKMKRVLLG